MLRKDGLYFTGPSQNFGFNGNGVLTYNMPIKINAISSKPFVKRLGLDDNNNLVFDTSSAASDTSNLDAIYAKQDTTKLYHSISYLDEGTFSNNGTSVVGTETSFNSTHIGSKLVKTNGETAIIATVTDFTHVTTVEPFKTNSINTSYTTYHVALEIKNDGSLVNYSYIGDVITTMNSAGKLIINQQEFNQDGSAKFNNAVKFGNTEFYEDEINLAVWGQITSRGGTSGSADVGLRRNSVGVFEINNGTPENYGNLKVKTLNTTSTAYADDASADADTSLASGDLYWVIGDRTARRKP